MITEEERERFSSDHLFCLSALEQAGFLTPMMREEVILRAMAMDIPRLQTAHFNWLLQNVIHKYRGPRSASICLPKGNSEETNLLH